MHRSSCPTPISCGEEGGPGFFVDAGGPVAPLIEAADQHGITPTHVLLTHHHYDHVCELDQLTERWPGMEVLIHDAERAEVPGANGADDAGHDRCTVGDLEVTPLHTPGHTAGHARAPRRRATSSPATRSSRTRSAACARPGSTGYEDLKALDHGRR